MGQQLYKIPITESSKDSHPARTSYVGCQIQKEIPIPIPKIGKKTSRKSQCSSFRAYRPNSQLLDWEWSEAGCPGGNQMWRRRQNRCLIR